MANGSSTHRANPVVTKSTCRTSRSWRRGGRCRRRGGLNPMWTADGRALYFRRGATLYRVPVEREGSALKFGGAIEVYNALPAVKGDHRAFAVFPNGDALVLKGTAGDQQQLPQPVPALDESGTREQGLGIRAIIYVALVPGTTVGAYQILAHARRRRHGRGVSRARSAARPRCRAQSPARRRWRAIRRGSNASRGKHAPSPPSTIRTSSRSIPPKKPTASGS